jgi:hypothetical protein
MAVLFQDKTASTQDLPQTKLVRNNRAVNAIVCYMKEGKFDKVNEIVGRKRDLASKVPEFAREAYNSLLTPGAPTKHIRYGRAADIAKRWLSKIESLNAATLAYSVNMEIGDIDAYLRAVRIAKEHGLDKEDLSLAAYLGYRLCFTNEKFRWADEFLTHLSAEQQKMALRSAARK